MWWERVWAEYLTLGATASFLPLELYELSKQRSLSKGMVLALNVAIVLYLAWRVQHRRTV